MTFHERLLRAFIVLLIGLIGSVALYIAIDFPQAFLHDLEESLGLDEQAVRLRAFCFNAILVTIGVTLGAVFAHRAGFVSLVAHRVEDAHKRFLTLAIYIVAGLLLGAALWALDSWLMRAVPSLPQFINASPNLSALNFGLITRSLYGGLAEEIMWRFGVLSLIAWLLLRFLPRGWAVAIAILAAGLLFGLDHLPLVMEMAPDVPQSMILRVVFLNMLAGIAFGVAYTRNSLEAAMVMHASMHVLYSGVGIGIAFQ